MSLRSAVAALVSVACLAAAPDSALAKGPTKRKVTLAVDGMGCAHEVEPKPAKLEKKKEDALGLRLRNDCGVLRKVLVCVYDAKGALANPFGACTSAPPGLGIAAPLTLRADGGTAEIDCPAQQEGSYLAVVLVGDEIKPAGCPAAPPKEKLLAVGEKTFNHRLAVEIVP